MLVEEQKQEEIGYAPRKIQASNPAPLSENNYQNEEEAKKKITMLQNLYIDEKSEVEKLRQKIEELTKKIDTDINGLSFLSTHSTEA